MLKIYNLKDKKEYLRQVCILTINQWSKPYKNKEEFENKIQKKIDKIESNWDNPKFCKLILLDDENLVGFISIFPHDSDEKYDLSPWYATMFVKEEYRGHGYSRILNDAILEEAKKRHFEKIYLKTDLDNYYEKFGAIYIEDLKNGEKLYYFNLK